MNNPFLTKIFYFNAAHQYGHDDWSDDKNWNVFGPDSKVHGHNYTLEVMVTGEVNNDTGFIVDLGHLKEVEWFNDKQPSSENLVQFIWSQIEPYLKDVTLYRIRLRETPTIFTDYYG